MAEVRAVLVGVSDYLVLDADLKGPANDVRLMAETLALRGVDPRAMTVLTAEPAACPTAFRQPPRCRDTILAAMDAVAAASVAGDTVVFYFSGHGAQAPDMSGDEGGGYDEILLPADAAGWKGAIGAVENAILDDELQVWARGMLSRGVQVVGLIDACHSATGFRAVGGQGVARVVDEAALGIPEDVVPVTGAPLPPLTGQFVFLYSSQSDQRSFEYPLADGATWHGRVHVAAGPNPAGCARGQLGASAGCDDRRHGARPARQMPEGEGTLLEAQVFGTGAGAARMAVADGRLAAGLLHGLATGAEVALFAGPSGGTALAVLPLGEVTARQAALAGDVPDGALWAELVNAAPPAPLVLAAPVRADMNDGFDYSRWEAALPPGGPDADLVPILTGGVVALAEADGVLDPAGPGSSPRIVALPGMTEAEAVAQMLEQAAHGLGLRAALSGATGRALAGKQAISMAVERRAADATCGTLAQAVPYEPAAGVAPCDQLWLTLTNTGGKAQDVSVLYFAADFTVAPIWPVQNLTNRLAPGETVRVGLRIEDGSVAGLEEIWVLAVPVDPDAPRVDLTRLASPATDRALAGLDPMTEWLESRLPGDGTATRGFTLKPAPLTMIRQQVRLTPRDG